ncbi:MAG: hypothetical protein ABSG81_15395 [Acidimicrobiales bacterium]
MTLGQRCDEIIKMIDDVLGGLAGDPGDTSTGRGGGHAFLEVGLSSERGDVHSELWA